MVDVGTCVVHDHVDALFVNPTAELLSFGGVATINGDFSEVLGDTSGLFDDARSDGSGIGSAGRNTHAGDERWRDGSERYFVGVAAPDHRTNGRGEMHIKAHYDAGRLVVGGAFVCGSSVESLCCVAVVYVGPMDDVTDRAGRTLRESPTVVGCLVYATPFMVSAAVRAFRSIHQARLVRSVI